MKKFITMLMLTGAALMAQSGSAPATSSSNATPTDKATPKVTKKHHKAKKNATTAPAANAVSNGATNAAPAKK